MLHFLIQVWLFSVSFKLAEHLIVTVKRRSVFCIVFDISTIFHNMKQASVSLYVGYDLNCNIILLRRLHRSVVVEVLFVF